tara:strand:- start:2070 stop:2738 length:669 start_codon:yes stop_codon:yes gene_type:complete
MGVKNIAIFGGTFDPVHKGHLYAVEIAIKKLFLDKLIIVVAKDQWRRNNIIQASPSERLDMVNLAINEERLDSKTRLLNYENKFIVEVSDIDIKRKGKTYTIDTINEIRSLYGKKHSYFFLIGADVALDIHNWKNFNDINSLVNIVVVNRKIHEKIMPEIKERYNFLSENLIEGVSDETSTNQRLGWSNKGFLEDHDGGVVKIINYASVVEYISKNKLYGYA